MTQPAPRLPSPTRVEIQQGITRGADGTPWPKIRIAVGFAEMTFIVPPDVAEKIGPRLASEIAESVRAARLAAAGIVLPQQPPPNGHHIGPLGLPIPGDGS